MKRYFQWLGCLSLLLVAGCGGGVNSAMKPAARAWVIAGAYDRGNAAIGAEDDKTVIESLRLLKSVGAGTEEEQLALKAFESLTQRRDFLRSELAFQQNASKKLLLARADSDEEITQHLILQFYLADPSDPDALNTVGYTLADSGTTPEEWARAESMIRRALALLGSQPRTTEKPNPLLEQTAMTRDSLAWALFREKNFKEALAQQQRAMKEYVESGLDAGGPGDPEMHYHLGAIWQALGNKQQARAEYDRAIKVEPGYDQAIAAERSLG